MCTRTRFDLYRTALLSEETELIAAAPPTRQSFTCQTALSLGFDLSSYFYTWEKIILGHFSFEKSPRLFKNLETNRFDTLRETRCLPAPWNSLAETKSFLTRPSAMSAAQSCCASQHVISWSLKLPLVPYFTNIMNNFYWTCHEFWQITIQQVKYAGIFPVSSKFHALMKKSAFNQSLVPFSQLLHRVLTSPDVPVWKLSEGFLSCFFLYFKIFTARKFRLILYFCFFPEK